MRHPSFRIVLAAVPLLVSTACNTKVSIGLGTDLYGECLVGDEAAGRMLVMCQNPLVAARPAGDQKSTARKVAEYVRDHHEKYKGAEDVTVIFLGKKDVSETDLKRSPRYTFTRADLGKPQPSSSAQVDSGAVADTSAAG